MLSVTVNDRFGRMLCGQTLDALLVSVSHASLFSVGLNCSFGAAEMLPCLRSLSSQATCYVSAHPNAGLPNELGGYDQTPSMMAESMKPFVEEGLVNILGGCCGTTPEHIRALRPLVDSGRKRFLKPLSNNGLLRLSGLEALTLTPEVGFINVGERCNVAGSRKFLRLIKEKAYDEALAIARKQVEDGALVLDINMDDGLLDAASEMRTFLNLLGSEPDICRVPLMLDSSKWDVIEEGLKCVQGKCIVNSISLKEGHDVFLEHARRARSLGAAVIVMAFDEQGQADTFERRIEICERAFHILRNEANFPPEDIIFDPNVLAIATGIPEHDGYALDFIRATEWIHTHLIGTHVSGGVSNLSFAFRGNNYLREAMHAIFLYHARRAGMDMAILNPSTSVIYSEIPKETLEVIEDAILRPSVSTTERLTQLAEELSRTAETSKSENDLSHTNHADNATIEERLITALIAGGSETLENDLFEAVHRYDDPVGIIEGPLMEAMRRVGQLFGEGKMFLPQVVKTARTMKRAVAILSPFIQSSRSSGSSSGRVLLATVKGDVHDIGKNIVGMVMACNGFEIIDLGVMVPAEEIVAKAQELKPDIIGLSGLITPSLEEMVRVVRLLRTAGISVPVMIGGATTSEVHTALCIAPVYSGPVVWVRDASLNAPLASQLLNSTEGEALRAQINKQQDALRRSHNAPRGMRSLEDARKNRLNLFPTASKTEIRAMIAEQKRALSVDERQRISQQVCTQILNSRRWQEARVVLLYHPLPDELDVSPLLSKGLLEGKTVLLPVVSGDDLLLVPYNGRTLTGAFGVQEPEGEPLTNLDSIHLAIIPGIAFDRDGHRLGRGRGYYDRLLPHLSAWKVGICYPFQLIDLVPSESHDVVMDEVITLSSEF